MRMTIPIGLTLLLASGSALAWQPVVYPIRSQSPTQQNIDAALCYGMANKQTNVNITREAQDPVTPKLDVPIAGSGASQAGLPPLPASGVGAASGTAANAGMPASAGATAGAGASATATAKGTPAMPSGAMPGSEATAQAGKTGASEASGATAASGASDGQATTEAEVKLPPPPPPEPPMTRYWRAYGACMQQRGYVVQ